MQIASTATGVEPELEILAAMDNSLPESRLLNAHLIRLYWQCNSWQTLRDNSKRVSAQPLICISRGEAAMNPAQSFGAARKRPPTFFSLVVLLGCWLDAASATQPTTGISFAQLRSQGTPLPYLRISVASAALYGSGYINVERYQDGKAVAASATR